MVTFIVLKIARTYTCIYFALTFTYKENALDQMSKTLYRNTHMCDPLENKGLYIVI